MEENLILSENFPELLAQFMDGEFYQIQESRWYDKFEYEGENKYRFLNIVNHTENKSLSEEDSLFFYKFTNAIQSEKYKMDKDGFAVLNISLYPGVEWKNIIEVFQPNFCFFWGVSPSQFGVNINKYKASVHDSIKMLYVDSMNSVFSNSSLKLQLWEQTKPLFGIK
jgi:hypothetical protein